MCNFEQNPNQDRAVVFNILLCKMLYNFCEKSALVLAMLIFYCTVLHILPNIVIIGTFQFADGQLRG